MSIFACRTGYSRQLFFIGDSLSEYGNGNTRTAYEMPYGAYNGLTKTGLSVTVSAIAGSEIYSGGANSFIDRISPYLAMANTNDIFVIFGGTNDISISGKTAAQTYSALCSLATTIRNAGCQVVAVTMLAKERAADANPTAIEVVRLAYNSLIMGGSSFVFDAYANAGALTQFDSVADASNTTYYNADKVHLTTAGYTLVSTNVTAAIQSLL